MTASELREAYLAFFEARGHRRVPSDSLIPSNDPTLLFTSAGMVQFKPLYMARERPYRTATSCQKCVRTTDIDRVGLTARHLTFFEMLGNFSFGDYFKEGAIAYAWEFLTDRRTGLGLDPKRLVVSVFERDEEAARLWAKYPLKNPIVRFGAEDNYWPAGSALRTWAGPNGPCSEIYYDFGEACCARAGHANPCEQPGDHECDRFREIWNLVFPQFHRDPKTGENPPMAAPGIDTGMGLERMCAVLQDKDSVFDTDVFAGIMARALEALEARRTKSLPAEDVQRSQRIVADHVRAAVFMVSDGILPSNEGRGYILRRVIRRATRQSALFGEPKPVVAETVPAVVAAMGAAYPELIERADRIAETIRAEELRFIETLQRGLEELEKERAAGTDRLSGGRAFYFYDTFGFPRELTEDIWTREMRRALSPGFDEEYRAALEAQQERARAAWKGSGARALSDLHHALARELGPTAFTGYDGTTGAARVTAIVRTGGDGGREGVRAAAAEAGEEVEVMLDSTPLYAESGGQVADRGRLIFDGGEAEVLDVQKPVGGLIIHRARVVKGRLMEGKAVRVEADPVRRAGAMRHHTATHLLHAALHRHVGPSATQAGSLVAPDRLRFDFQAAKPVGVETLRAIEQLVGEKILEAMPVTTTVVSLEEAKRRGAMMLFGEKYGERVRMVEIGDFSRELCGGLHVRNSAAVGPFLLIAESSVAAGVRRVEALAGDAALRALAEGRAALERSAALLRCAPAELESRVARLLDERRRLEEALSAERRRRAAGALEASARDAAEIGGVKVLLAEVEAADARALRELADRALDRLKDGVVLLGARADGKCHLVARVSASVSSRAPAGEVVRVAAAAVGGTGGGRPEMAQAGGKDPARLPEAFERARAYLAKALAG